MGEVGYNLPVSNKQNYRKEKSSFLIRLVLRSGIAKNKKQANIVLLFIAGILIFLTIFYIIPLSKGMKFDSVEQPEDYMDFENL